VGYRPVFAAGGAAALWNLGYDGGMGLGAAGFSLLAVHTGYPAAFALTAAMLPAVLPVARTIPGRRPGAGIRAPEARTTSRSG
jgi:hypothetical protein